MRITITVRGRAERLLTALCEQTGNTPEDFARDGVAGALNAFDYQRVDSRGLMTPMPSSGRRRKIGPDLLPGEAERVRALARLTLDAATMGGDREELRRRMHALWPEGLLEDEQS